MIKSQQEVFGTLSKKPTDSNDIIDLDFLYRIYNQLSNVEKNVDFLLPEWVGNTEFWSFIHLGLQNKTFDWRFVSLQQGYG